MYRIVFGLLTFSPLLCAQERLGPETQTHRTGGLDPVASHAKMVVADDLVVDSLLSEPLVRQPVFLNFDERGRMWVVQPASTSRDPMSSAPGMI